MDNENLMAILGRQLLAMREQLDAMLIVVNSSLPKSDDDLSEDSDGPVLPPVFGNPKE